MYFSTIKNHKLQKLLINKLKKSKLIKFKTHKSCIDIYNQKYKLIINCDPSHQISKNFFFRKN